MSSIYLDNNATTPLDERVLNAMHIALKCRFANPASAHQAGQLARKRLNEARDSILNRLNAKTTGTDTDRLIFTSGGTESNNLAISGLANFAVHRKSKPKRIIVSSIEHPSVSEVAANLENLGFVVEKIQADGNGTISIQHLSELLKEPAALVSLMSVNNETGVIQPIELAAGLCATAGVAFHTDAVQGVAKIPIDFSKLRLSALTLTSHKLHGPRGIGGLILQADSDIEPIMFGGFQQLGSRPGTEDVALATGFTMAVDLAFEEQESRSESVASFRDQFENHLLNEFNDSIRVIGSKVPRAPHTSNIAFLGGDRQAIVLSADMAGVCCSTGSACASGSSEPSPVLLAMGCNDEEIGGAVRFSFSPLLTAKEVEIAAQRVTQVVRRLHR